MKNSILTRFACYNANSLYLDPEPIISLELGLEEQPLKVAPKHGANPRVPTKDSELEDLLVSGVGLIHIA